ncbi:MAG: hypothetical protein GXX91_10560 [Verrucomicrobiaceae bacterium]|nr:hypothetical protein [Verrucomicrobiaceae bacterium]
MILPSTSPPARTTVTPERVLFGFSLRLHLLHRALLRTARNRIPGAEASGGTTRAAETVRDFHHDFVVFTRARLERPFAAMHGRELRLWEAHLAGILRRRAAGDAVGFRDLLDEMEAIAGDGEVLLLHLRHRAAREMARMLLCYRRALARIEASRPEGEEKIVFLRTGATLSPGDWEAVLTRIRSEQGGDFAPVKRGSWRCLETALGDVTAFLSSPPTVSAYETKRKRNPRTSSVSLGALGARERLPAR